MALLIGLLLVSALGIGHHYGLLIVRAIKPDPGGRLDGRPQAAIMLAFLGLLALRTLEVLAFAAAYRKLLNLGFLGDLGGGFDGSWSGLIYYSGINFATLGYTQIEAQGPIRMIGMMQSLGGFMVLTGSSTYIYSISEGTLAQIARRAFQIRLDHLPGLGEGIVGHAIPPCMDQPNSCRSARPMPCPRWSWWTI